MEVLALIIIVLIWAFKAAVANEDKKVNDRETKSNSMPAGELVQRAKEAARTPDDFNAMQEKKRLSGVQIRDLHQKRSAQERAASEKRWEAARRKQADRGEVHSVHMDSCEDRLESLKVLYDAGILDREEYAQRVARVKRQHAQSRN